MAEFDLRRALEDVGLFKGLSKDELQQVMSRGAFMEFDANELIMEEGRPNETFYLLLRGTVEVYLPKRVDAACKRIAKVKIRELAAGELFGEYSLIDNLPASASVITCSPVQAFVLHKEDFDTLVTEYDRIGRVVYYFLVQRLVERLRATNRELDLDLL